MMVLVIRDVALEGYKYIRRSGNIVCVFMCKVDIDSWPSYYFNGSYYIYIYIYIWKASGMEIGLIPELSWFRTKGLASW